MDNEQKERLEQELRFLKESLEADVISKDEYEKGKERIERKLKEIEEGPTEEPPIEKPTEAEKTEELKEDIEIKEFKEKPTKIIGIEEEEMPEEPKKEETKESPIEIEKVKEKEESIEEEITFSKKWVYALAIMVIVAILFLSIRSCYKPSETTIEEPTEEFIPICSSNSDCKQKGKVGFCLSPGTEEAACEFKEDIRVELTVINDKNCKLCDSDRMKQVINEIFPNTNIKNIDYITVEAKQSIEKLGIDSLPAYIFDSNLTKAINFDDFKRALVKKGDKYIMTNTASGSNYYFKREKISNRLDIFLTADIEEKVDKNIEEFLTLFGSGINFTKKVVTEDTKITEELGINSYPAFLINNQFKFGGLNSADSIKEKFCEINKLEECKQELSKDIK